MSDKWFEVPAPGGRMRLEADLLRDADPYLCVTVIDTVPI